jgi:hypothetical protein
MQEFIQPPRVNVGTVSDTWEYPRNTTGPEVSALAFGPRFDVRMKDPFIREKFTKEQSHARQHAKEYFQRYPKDRYQTEVESWRNLQSANIEFTMKRLREPIEG